MDGSRRTYKIGDMVLEGKKIYPVVVAQVRAGCTELVTKIDIPVYFVMGKYDGMTSPGAAERYLHCLTGDGTKEFVLFEESAHYPQFEQEEDFYQWMKNVFCK